MKSFLLKINSVVPYGIGGPAAGFLEIIYHFLMNDYGQDFYKIITINQIGSELTELILKDENRTVYCNIRYPSPTNFEKKSDYEQNRFRLDVVHAALLRIAEKENKLDSVKLNKIKETILKQNFSFEFTFKKFQKNNLVAKLIILPEFDKFNILVEIEESGLIIYRAKIFTGIAQVFYLASFFKFGKWKQDKFLITGTEKEVEIQILFRIKEFRIINLTPFEKPPFFSSLKA